MCNSEPAGEVRLQHLLQQLHEEITQPYVKTTLQTFIFKYLCTDIINRILLWFYTVQHLTILIYHLQGHGEPGVNTSWHWDRGRVHLNIHTRAPGANPHARTHAYRFNIFEPRTFLVCVWKVLTTISLCCHHFFICIWSQSHQLFVAQSYPNYVYWAHTHLWRHTWILVVNKYSHPLST